MRTLEFNTAALEGFGDTSKVRVKTLDGVLFIRPTDRKSHVNLPKGEKLVDLVRKGNVAKITVEGFEVAGEVGASLALQKAKYGWIAAAGEPAKGAARVKIAA